MVEYYVEPAGNDGNLGTAPGAGNAWLTVKYALETAGVPGLVAGDNVWIRRTHNEIPAGPADISPAFDGDEDNPISVIGWPRDEATGTATFTNGSTAVTVVSIAGDREKHAGRRIKCDADGKWYLITRVVGANEFTIDREYAGTTAAVANFTIQKDDDFDTRPVAGQAPWDGDADDLPVIDFNGAAFELYYSLDYSNILKNLEIKNSLDNYGAVRVRTSNSFSIIGCLLYTNQNAKLVLSDRSFIYCERVIFEGNGAGAAQNAYTGDSIHLKDCAIYNMGNVGIVCDKVAFLENVNIGVEIANGNDDIMLYTSGGLIQCRDVKLGGTNGDVLIEYPSNMDYASFENYNKILGAHKTWFAGGTMEKVTAGLGAPIPDQRAGGAANLIEITPNVAGYEYIEEWAVEVFTHEFEVDTTNRSYRYYVQTSIVGGLAASDLWITAEYISDYDDTSEYVIDTQQSDEVIAARANIADWSQFIEVTAIAPATTGKVRIRCYVSAFDAANKIWIDPKVVIS